MAASAITERASAKVNLTLRVLGRRADGYHELESLVVFAKACADEVTLTRGTSDTPRVMTTGPYAGGIAGANLISVALERVARAAPQLRLGDLALEKNLPIAAGIGGGSADAAAVLRAVRAANPELAGGVDWSALALSLGADVPVCLDARPQLMRGVGDQLDAMPQLPELAAVLVNPRVPVPEDKTAQVFRALAAPRLTWPPRRITPTHFATRDDLVLHMRAVGNDLLAPARRVVAQIDTVLSALTRDPACELAQLSGGGPTCFGIYADMKAAEQAALDLKARYPAWWVAATELG